MNRLTPLLLALAVLAAPLARGQFRSFSESPVEITGEHTNVVQGLFYADGNVVIRYGDASIFCDSAQYNPDTHDVLLMGNIRIYRDGRLFTGARAIYNVETKKLTAADFAADAFPFNVEANTLTSIGPNAYEVHDAIFTTSDNSKTDYHVAARGARIYAGDRIVLRDVTLYIGQTPVFWLPYLYQSLNKSEGFMIIPGYNTAFGAYARARATFPVGNDFPATVDVDFLEKRGVGLGISSRWKGVEGTEQTEWGRFQAYYINDQSTTLNTTSLARENVKPNRYRISLQDRTLLAEDLFWSVNINRLSDARFLQDFVPNQFRTDPNPDNMMSLEKWNEDYTLTLTGRYALNKVFDSTERLPELAFDGLTHPIFGDSGLYSVTEVSAGYFKRYFAKGSVFPAYSTFRGDAFFQINYPKTYFGWLSVNPKMGLRETYYQNSGTFDDVAIPNTTTLSDGTRVTANTVVPELFKAGSTIRTVFNTGVEGSFKLSRAYEQVQSRGWGLDGLLHVIQPYTDLSYVWTSKNPNSLLQFDRINPTTQRPPLDFPDFNSIDAIENWSIARLGVNNRFLTRRDNLTYDWLDWSAYVDVNIQRPHFEETFLSLPQAGVNYTGKTPIRGIVADPGTFSNVYNRINFQPYTWLHFALDGQFPILDKGFTEINSNFNFLINSDTSVLVGHSYIAGNPLFRNSDLVIGGVYRKLSDNWAISALDAYEFQPGYLESQRYTVHRDLSSWVASLGFGLINNGAGKQAFNLTLTFTLKDLPGVSVPFSFDPEQVLGTSKNQ